MPPRTKQPAPHFELADEDNDSMEDFEMDMVAGVAASTSLNAPVTPSEVAMLRSPRASPADELLALPAPAAGGGGDDPAATAAASPSSPVPPRSMRQAQRHYVCESDNESGDEDNDPPWQCDEEIDAKIPGRTSSSRGHSLTSMASSLFKTAGYDDVIALAHADLRFDIDGYSNIYRSEAVLRELERVTGDLRIPIHPIGADFAKQRMLYDPARFAMIGLAQPESRRGMGIAIERNKHGWSLDELGMHVDYMGFLTAVLTAEMVDTGLDKVHKFLTVEADGQHYAAKGLQRLDFGSHGVWVPHSSVMFYKLIQAAVHCELAIVIFDFGQKAMCAAASHHPHIPLTALHACG